MTINKQIPQADWKDFFVTFSNGNRGREISLEVFDSESGDLGPAKQGPLMAVDYDPQSQGNNIVVTTGVDEITYSHTIHAPVEVWRAQKDDGQVASLEIVDQNQVKSIVSLK